MTGKRLVCAAALLTLALATGCQTWCNRHYPCAQPACYPAASCCQPCACTPCCAPGTFSGYPAPAAAAAPAPAWTNPTGAPVSRVPAACLPCDGAAAPTR